MKKRCYKCNLILENFDLVYGLHESCFLHWFNLTAPDFFEEIVAQPQSQEYTIAGVKSSSFFHGMFRKYSSTLSGIKYILKIQEEGYPELPATEYLCNQIFTLLKIKVAPFYLIDFEEQQICFVTKNFMSHFHESNLVHLYHYFTPTMRYNCENIVTIISEKVGRLSAIEDFIYVTLADSLIGNHDRYGRNLAFIQTSQGYTLSPFYDNVSYLGTELDSLLAADHQPKGKIETRVSSEPSMKDYIEEWNRLGFGYVIERFRKDIPLDKIKKLVEDSNLSEKRQKALLRIIGKRGKELWQ